jgi:hypothetical protein
MIRNGSGMRSEWRFPFPLANCFRPIIQRGFISQFRPLKLYAVAPDLCKVVLCLLHKPGKTLEMSRALRRSSRSAIYGDSHFDPSRIRRRVRREQAGRDLRHRGQVRMDQSACAAVRRRKIAARLTDTQLGPMPALESRCPLSRFTTKVQSVDNVRSPASPAFPPGSDFPSRSLQEWNIRPAGG